ncbi:MAG: FHA domain-containing protein, partial [Acidimicrobiales bacterium]
MADLVGALEGSESLTVGSILVERTGQLLSPKSLLAQADIRSGDAVRVVEIDPRSGFPCDLEPGRPTATLGMLSGPQVGSMYGLGPGSSSIGRVSSNDVVIVDPGISRHHAVVT